MSEDKSSLVWPFVNAAVSVLSMDGGCSAVSSWGHRAGREEAPRVGTGASERHQIHVFHVTGDLKDLYATSAYNTGPVEDPLLMKR